MADVNFDDFSTLIVDAPAKVNLNLHILSLRQDGYHELQSLMQKLELADRITLNPSAGLELSCSGSSLPEDENNLVFRAAQFFLEKVPDLAGVRIQVEKNIPVSAGLGGGSSDAGVVLKALNHLAGHPLTSRELEKIGILLGADVPFFVSDCRSALASGIGERLEEHQPLSGYWCLLVNPGYEVSTRDIYNRFDKLSPDKIALTRDHNSYKYVQFKNNTKLACFNDLETATFEKHPELSGIKDSLLNAGAFLSLLAGSGPTVFGLFDDLKKAESCRDKFAGFYPVVILTRTQ